MAWYEIPLPRTASEDISGTRSRTRTFQTNDRTDQPPLADPSLPSNGSPHPTEPALRMKRRIANPIGLTEGWQCECVYENFTSTGGTTPRQDPNEVGTWRWNETNREVGIKCPIAKLTTKSIPAGNGTGAPVQQRYYAQEETIVASDSSELTIEVVTWSPSLEQRIAIRDRIGQLHKFGDDPRSYKYKGCDTQPLGLGIRGDDYSAQIVRFIHRWDGDSGSSPPLSTDGLTTVGGGSEPLIILPNFQIISGGFEYPLFRPPHHVWVMSPSPDGGPSARPVFSVLRTAVDDVSLYSEWRNLPGMEYVSI